MWSIYRKLKDESSFGSEGVCAVAFGTEMKAHEKIKPLRWGHEQTDRAICLSNDSNVKHEFYQHVRSTEFCETVAVMEKGAWKALYGDFMLRISEYL